MVTLQFRSVSYPFIVLYIHSAHFVFTLLLCCGQQLTHGLFLGRLLYGPPHMAEKKHDDQNEHTFNNYVRIRDVVQKTCQRRWTIGKSGERGSGISVLSARHDDDDDESNWSRSIHNWRESFARIETKSLLRFKYMS